MATTEEVQAFEEALAASLAEANEDRGLPEPESAAAAVQARREASEAATMDRAAFLAWVDDGREIVGRLWDSLEPLDSYRLINLLQLIQDRELGLLGVLRDVAQRIEKTLGDRHGRGPIEDSDGIVVAQVDKGGASVKWDVEAAWGPLPANSVAAGRAQAMHTRMESR